MIERQELTRKYDDGIHDTYREERERKKNILEHARERTYMYPQNERRYIDGIHIIIIT